MKRWKRTNLLDLPVLPYARDGAAATNRVIATFVKERTTLTSPMQLRAFVRRWQAIWLLQAGPGYPPGSAADETRRPLDSYTRTLLEGRYDAKRVFRFVNHKQGEELSETDSRDFRIACCIAMPGPTLPAFFMADKYGVGSDLAMVRLYLDTYPALADVGRPFTNCGEGIDEEEDEEAVA